MREDAHEEAGVVFGGEAALRLVARVLIEGAPFARVAIEWKPEIDSEIVVGGKRLVVVKVVENRFGRVVDTRRRMTFAEEARAAGQLLLPEL